MNESMRKVKAMQDGIHELYSGVFNTDSGQKIIKDLEDLVKYNDSIVTDKINPNPYEALYREGMRDVVSRLKNYSNVELFNKKKELMKKLNI